MGCNKRVSKKHLKERSTCLTPLNNNSINDITPSCKLQTVKPTDYSISPGPSINTLNDSENNKKIRQSLCTKISL